MRKMACVARCCFTVLLAVLFGVSCTTVPETGRKQFNMILPSEEMQLGLSSFTKMKKEVPISNDPAANALLQKVGQRISAVANLPGAQWEFVVFESKEVNASCLPGGKVGVYTGILPITKNEDGLATEHLNFYRGQNQQGREGKATTSDHSAKGFQTHQGFIARFGPELPRALESSLNTPKVWN